MAVTLNSIGDGVIATATDGTIVMLNKVAQLLTGWKEHEAVNKKLDEVFHIVNEKNREKMTGFVQQVLETKQVIEFSDDLVLIGRDGNEYLIEDSAAPIFDRLSEVLGVVIVFRDVSDEKRMEEELQKARKIESIGLLAGGIAHDFNNILTAITGNISLAKMLSEPDSKIHTRLAEAEKACMRATGLTQRLITFSKGGAPIKTTTTLRKLLEDSATHIRRDAKIEVDYSVQKGLHPCEIDRGQIGQVFRNIIINAEQAMPAGGIIHVAAENISVTAENNLPLKNGEYVKVVIRDNGAGIAPEIIGKIFDPYFSTKEKASGLGLASSYSIIKNHGGFIAVESKVGAGSTFSIYLPAAAESIAPDKPSAARKVIQGKGKILILDDEESVRLTARDMLAHLGYESELAKDGNEAIAMYQAAQDSGSPFVAVILDLTIPGGMGGRETIKKLKEIAPDVKAIVSSGYSSDPIMSDYEQYGFSGIIIKPYRINDIGDVLKKTIAGKSAKK